jgi:phage-related protein
MRWTISFHETARAEAEAQPADIRARLQRVMTLISEHGPDRLPPRAAKHLKDGLWELRLKGKDSIARAFYVTRTPQRLVIVRVFTKKTQKTPPREIKLAVRRAEEIL